MIYMTVMFALCIGSMIYLYNRLPAKTIKIRRVGGLNKTGLKKNKAIVQDDSFCRQDELRKTDPNKADLN